MSEKKPLVGVVMGSASDRDVMLPCVQTLQDLEIPHEVKILSAHRTPQRAQEYAMEAAARGLRVLIAGAGWAAHLAGALAANSLLPVIGVPIDSSPLKGLDALLATVQMPPGIPVATMAIGGGGAKNAALFAAQILALQEEEIARRFTEYRREMTAAAERNIDRWDL